MLDKPTPAAAHPPQTRGPRLDLQEHLADLIAGNSADSGLLVDATRKRPMPPLALPTREHMKHARGLWEELGLPALNVRSPWYGCTLDNWTETWETFTQRAVAGDWELTSLETLKRQRKGKMPEPLVRPGDDETVG